MGVGEKKQEYKEKIETERKKERLRYIGERERERVRGNTLSELNVRTVRSSGCIMK